MTGSTGEDVKVVAVVPARMASSRFPGKPLTPIRGLPMVEHVRRRAALARTVDRIVVATCDASILDAVSAAGGEAVMTRDDHERCTDRVDEAMAGLEADIVVIVQGDEPLLDPTNVDAVVAPLLGDPGLLCTNLLSVLTSERDAHDPDIVKACCDQSGNVIFLSRAPVPFRRGEGEAPVYRQTGIMAFRSAFLREFSRLPETPFERVESIDMMRVIEHGHSIRGVVTGTPTVGVDRLEDVAVVEEILSEDAFQRDLLEAILGQPGDAR